MCIRDSKKKEDLVSTNDLASKLLDDETDEEEADLTLEVSGDEDLVEETQLKKAEPKGNFNFLNLDEIEAFKEQLFPSGSLFEPAKDWKERQKQFDNAREYTVSGLITEMVLRDGRNSGEKICFLTLEDYTGSYSFRLGDRDYMKLREKIAKDRFVIVKMKFTQGSEGRVFTNVTDILDLKDAFEKYAKSLSLVIPINELNKTDLEFFKTQLLTEKGEHKLNVFLKNPLDNSFVAVSYTHLDVYKRQDQGQ